MSSRDGARDPARDPALIALLYALADDELVLGHRNSEWTGHAPILEEDIAFSNIAQDEMGHALLWYGLLHELGEPDPDRLVFWRDLPDWRNAIFVELPKGDWAVTVTRQFLFDSYEQLRNGALAASAHAGVRDIVAKIDREELYHRMHSRGWVERLGDATEESHRRMQSALEQLWPHALGLFEPAAGAEALLPAALRADWEALVRPVLEQATLAVPAGAEPVLGGRQGRHSEHLTELLADLQKVARSEAPETLW
jgi:ring-1,2-phenylacetyl-CoA epoxidase subunit PaaC